MADFRPQSSYMGQILLSMRKLIDFTVFDDEGYVYIGRVAGSTPPYIGERFVCLTPGGVETFSDSGSGIWALPMSRTVTVTLCTRLSIDVANELKYAFTDVEYGHMYFEEAIINTLQLVNLRDEEDTTNLLYQPMRMLDSNPRYDITPDNPAKDMLITDINFELKYLFKTERST